MRGVKTASVALSTALLLAIVTSGSVRAQIDPLLFLKNARPVVLIALDLSSRMQRDLSGRYVDPLVYARTGMPWEGTIGVSAATASRAYRRRYVGLRWLDPAGPIRGVAAAIETIGDLQPGFESVDEQPRLALVRAALAQAVAGNQRSVRFGLVTSRQAGPRFDRQPGSLLLEPADPAALTETGTPGSWNGSFGSVDVAAAQVAAPSIAVPADAAAANTTLLARLARSPLQAGALVPAGFDGAGDEEAPLLRLLDDLRDEAARLVALDTSCRNTVAVLITGGGQRPAAASPASRANGFLQLSGRRVPVYVLALAPDPADVAGLRELAAVSGGRYVEIPFSAAPDVPQIVHAMTGALNGAVQHAFARFADLNTPPSAANPLGPITEYPMTPPVVGTVDLANLVTQSGVLLPLTRVTTPVGAAIPQRSNVLITGGLSAPGFEGRLRAFRVYRPEPDASAPTGFRFVADGTPLWVATTPEPGSRNIFTVLPGRGVVPFDPGQAAVLAPYLRSRDPAGLIAAIRGHPLGAVTSSTPALLTAPALPGGDTASRSFVESNQDRRALLFAGLDDGMMHAFDGRTGVEVWAVIPFNLLPRLKYLLDGQPVDAFRHYVGGSPRLADVLVGARWRTLLVFGEGAGGTFYQAFDVTLEGMAQAVPPAVDRPADLLRWFADPRRVSFLWSFPAYAAFDPAIGDDGDVGAGASGVEKSVGQSWSTPAILGIRREAPSLVLVGSGPLAASVQRQANRGGTIAGTRLYLLDAGSGQVLDSRDVGSDGEGEDQDGCPADGCRRFKNALASDVVAASPPAAGEAAGGYVGDLDGRLWRVALGENGGRGTVADVRLVFEAGPDHPLFAPVGTVRAGTAGTYVFLGTGGDHLPLALDRPASRIFTLLDTSSGVSRMGELSLDSLSGGGLDERLSPLPAVGGEVVFFATTAAASGRCEEDESRLYALTIPGGMAFDTTGDGRRDARDSRRVAAVRAGRATPPVVADRHLFMSTGDRLQVFGDPAGFNAGAGFVGVRMLSWREVGRAPAP